MPTNFKPQESVNDSENSDIFCMFTINHENNEESFTEIKVVEVEEIPGLQFTEPSTSSEPSEYVKHSYLDLKPLSFAEQCNLVRRYYLTIPNIIRFASIIVCLSWFCFNAYNVTKDFLHLNSIVIVEFKQSLSSRPPAISICTSCLLCNSFKNQTIYYQDILENAMVLAMFDKNGREVFADNTNVPPVDVQIRCKFQNNTIDSEINAKDNVYDCENYTDVIISLQKSRKCWTYFSEIYPVSQPAKPKIEMHYVYQPSIFFQVTGQMLWDNSLNSSVEMAIHSPSIMPISMDLIAHKLERQQITDLRFSKQEWKFRPPPSEPRCFKYRSFSNYDASANALPEELDKKCLTSSDAMTTYDGTPIYRSPAECFFYCQWRKLVKDNTINAIADLTLEITKRVRFLKDLQLATSRSKDVKQNWNNDDDSNWLKFESFNENTWLKYSSTQCHDLCPSECDMEAFPEIIAQKHNVTFNNNSAYVVIQWASPTILRMSYKENVGFSEFVGEIGGHLHIWCGVSLLGIICYLTKMIASRHNYRHSTFALLFTQLLLSKTIM